MKNTINSVWLALFLIAFVPVAYADRIDFTEIHMSPIPVAALNVSDMDLASFDRTQARNVCDKDTAVVNMIRLNTDGSLAFLLDVNRGQADFIPREVRLSKPLSAPVPEPGTAMLLSFGIMSAAMFFRKQIMI
ncbi:MAG: PEP-CTERM sorting domain-containing protein [Syntrophaceae bacterium]